MMHFKQYFYETLRMTDTNARNKLQAHPLVQQGTFGVEIEFIVMGMPVSEWNTDLLISDLGVTDFERKLHRMYASTDSGNLKTVNVMSSKEWNQFFDKYISTHKQDAVNAWMEEFEERTDNFGWSQIRKYWKGVVKKMIQDVGFPVIDGNSSGKKWGVGDDGMDSDNNKPVVEIRTGILTAADEPRLEQVLLGLQQLFKANKSYLRVAGNTGLHVHVSNPAINRSEGADPFTRLASISSVDEDKIWDDLARHDRAFERFSALNRQQDFSSHSDKGFHQMVIDQIWHRLNPDRSVVHRNPRGPVSFTVNLNMRDLEDFVQGFDRNVGINARSRQPTVEYRQLSSAMLTDPQGPQKVIDYIRYFLENTAGLSNKNQFVIKDEDVRVTFTRIQGGARIDFQKRASSDDRFSRVPHAGDKADSLRNFPKDNAPPWQAERFAPVAKMPQRLIQPPIDPDQAANEFRNMFDDN